MTTSGLTVRYGAVDRGYAMRLATTPTDQDGPIWMVNLMKYRDQADYGAAGGPAVSGREADDAYTPRESLRGIGAEIVFAADVDTQLLGSSPKWDRIGVVKYPTRRSFIEMQSRPDFQEKHVHKDAGMEQTIVMGCLPIETPRLPADEPAWDDVPHPPTVDDPSVVVIHVLKFKQAQDSIGEMASYTDHAGKVAVPHGVRIDGWFTVEGTIVGDGRSWSQVRFNAFPSKSAFMTVATDPERLKAQRAHRETALEDTYTMILRPTVNRLARSINSSPGGPDDQERVHR
jgi:hypothetical protein